jgi:RimJ/RimL family protein N-acetyltransferase
MPELISNAIRLNTELTGCFLRSWHVGDKASLIRHANNRDVWRNLTDMFPHPYTESDAEQWFAIASQANCNVHFAIELEGEAVGGAGLIAGSGIHARTANFGYWLAQAHWGKGIATASSRALLAYAFSKTEFVRLEAPVFAWNPASMRVLEKVGFVREGILRNSVFKDGQLIDSVMYSSVRPA